MNTYETMFITPPTLAEEDETTTIDAVVQIITDGGGNIIAKDLWGRRRLAYPIHKHEDGIYTRLLYEAAAEIPAEIERRNRLSDRVIRSLTIRLDKDQAVNAREQAVLDAERKIAEAKAAEERAKEEAAEAERKAAEAAANPPEEAAAEPAAEDAAKPAAEAAPAESTEGATETTAEPSAETPQQES